MLIENYFIMNTVVGCGIILEIPLSQHVGAQFKKHKKSHAVMN